MSRIQQDQFVDDDEEECCPLCVEEFDLSDRNFRPCPCGYQICQFCFNNIKTTMNGLCPACRRPYDESTIEFKNVTPEEMAKHKQQIAQKAKKNAALRQKEAQKAEADSLSRKHLAGLRVVQKNLVYVTGLTPTIREDRLLDTLRGPDYFGQYGKIIKIVVSKARENAQHQQSVGVYVTFARKEDATACIAAVDGSQNGDRTLRAQYGTTKYCSAYLRGEQCNNRNCMFLHEPGEENDSFTRQDLSMMNSIQTQQPTQLTSNAAPPPHRGPAVAAASSPPNGQDSNEAPSPDGDAPGLPATASWGSRAAQERRASRSTNASNSSPMPVNAVPAQPTPAQAAQSMKKEEEKVPKKKSKDKEKSAQASKAATPQPAPTPAPTEHPVKPRIPGLEGLLKTIMSPDFKFVFSGAVLSEEDLKAVAEFPQLIDPNGGAKRRAMKEKEREKEKELEQQREAEALAAAQNQAQTQAAAAVAEPEENTETTTGGSLQLGGEPEERQESVAGQGNRHIGGGPGQNNLGSSLFGQNAGLNDDFGTMSLNNRGLTQQQQQQMLLNSFKTAAPQSTGPASAFPGNQTQQSHGQPAHSGHARHASRFSFANDSASASASVQPVANQKLMNQQSAMMPKNSNHFNQMSQHQPLATPFYTSGVQGPPPGLKATGTPPASGGGMFGQGHGFASGALGYGANAPNRSNDTMYQDLLRSRNMDGGARGADAGKRESMFPSFLNQHPTTSTPAPAPGLLSFPYGPSPGAYQETGQQKSKKKGKKHRHANTSSSGGGGLVDVQDPSILQARMHQGGGMVGQGLYAGQGQDDPVFSLEEEASLNVDALVNDLDTEPLGHGSPVVPHILEQPRRATPTIPPGFAGHILPKHPTNPPSRPLSRNASAVTPAVPVVPLTPKLPAKVLKQAKAEHTPEVTPVQPSAHVPSAIKPETPLKAPRKVNVNSPQLKPDPTKNPEATSSKVEEKTSKPMSDSPVKTDTKGKGPAKRGQDMAPTASTPKKGGKDTVPATPVSTSSKRQHPGKLDISAATKMPETDLANMEGPGKNDAHKPTRSVSQAPATSVPASPAAAAMGSPVKRTTAPRTLRVLPTPKTEAPAPLSAVSVSSVPQVPPTVEKLRSRQASIASINLPATPANELASDTASITSTSVSRANSPPPLGGRVGTAPVRKKTKSQAKKERQERARQILEEQTIAAEDQTKSDLEPVQAPIIGRKKKTKKPAAAPPKVATAAAKAQPASPKPAQVEDAPEVEQSESNVSPAPPPPKKTRATPPSASSPRKSKTTAQAEQEDSKDKMQPSAQAIISDLQKTGELLASTLEFFKPLSSSLAHAARAAQSGNGAAPPDIKIHFSESDLDALARKKPVRLSGQGAGKQDARTLITPQGKFFWGLTQELEEKALQLEKHIEELRGSARYHPRKQTSFPPGQHMDSQAQSKDVLPAIATALKEAGAKLNTGGNNTSSSQMHDPDASLHGSPLPPVRSSDDPDWASAYGPPPLPAQRADSPHSTSTTDAGMYLNQFVLPKTDNPSPNSARSEMAAVGGPPGAGMGNMAVNVNKIAKAAKVVAEGGTLGAELDGMGVMAADLLGGVIVQGLEALVGAGLGFHSTQDLGVDSHGNITLGGAGMDVQKFVNYITPGGANNAATAPGGQPGARGRGRKSVLGVEEAEQAMQAAKKDHDALEKKLAATIKRNRKVVGKV